jgi:hypothetical protein
MDRREFFGATALAISAGLSLSPEARPAADPAGEALYNGIRLPAVWPPRRKELPARPVTPPYLEKPPAVIPIDLGRQLFVDDFLIERTTLSRTYHRPVPHAASPVLKPDQPWEREGAAPMAMVFSDGVWYDAKDRLFKMWYMGGYGRAVCHAVSEDGVRWTKPDLGVSKGTNIVHAGPRDSATVLLDWDEEDPERRFKLFRSHSGGSRFGLSVHFSRDGVHWADRAVWTGSVGDRTTVFYNPFRKVWVYSIRHGWGQPRRRRYWETRDLVKGPAWEAIDQPTMWVGADDRDPPRDDLKVTPELYNLDCVAYESLLLGLFSIWRGDRNIPPGRPKINEVCTGFSRDGFYWHRPDRRAFIGVSENRGDWNWGNVQSAGGCCLVVGDELYFYHSGRAVAPGIAGKRDGGGSTGLAVLRRDGFASMDAGETEGSLTTRPVRFTGSHLFVNVAAKEGELSAEVLDEGGRVLPGLARSACVPVRADRTRQVVKWKDADLAAAAGKPVKFRFDLKGGSLYAFWVSRDAKGSSQGYVAAGGPGLTNRCT